MDKPPPFFDPNRGDADPRMKVSPACERNREPILEVLKRVLPRTGLMLEIGAGTGQHAAYFAPHFPALTWQPTEIDPSLHASIAAWAQASKAANIRPPLALDVTANPWPDTKPSAMMSANMIHIAPWECCLGLMAGAGRVLKTTRGEEGRRPDRETTTGNVLALYGPFIQAGRPTAESNRAFDASLKARDPAWGIRDLEAVIDAADANGLDHTETVSMPANNLMVIFRRRG